jgi:hypothetical protein
MRYEQPQQIELSEAAVCVASGDPSLIGDALVRASLSKIDPTWVEAVSLRCAARPESELRWAALTALSHLVRRYRDLDVDAVRKAIDPLRDDPCLAGKVDDLLDDIRTYAP